jgi:peptidoglycan/LPS O-acetylase OafA/YrhL
MLFNNLKRITYDRPYQPEIDGIRFLCIFWVVVYHLWSLVHGTLGTSISGLSFVQNFVKYGSYGVSLFFILSGYMISMPFAKQGLIGSTEFH